MTTVVWLAIAPAALACPKTSLGDLEDEVMCPVCGTTLELASEAPQANRQREFIRGLIAEGRTKGEIKDALVDEYGPEILALPDTEGFDLLAWLVPGVGAILGAVAILVGLRRWRGVGGGPDGGGSAPSPPPAEAKEESERLDRELERHGY